MHYDFCGGFIILHFTYLDFFKVTECSIAELSTILYIHLTHCGRDKMAAISHTTFSNAFSWMKTYEFQLKFHWSLFPRVHLTYSIIGSDNSLAPNRRQAIIWTNDGLCFWCIFTSLGLGELTHTRPRDMARSRPPFWIFSFAAWKWVNMDGNWRNFDGNISSYV